LSFTDNDESLTLKPLPGEPKARKFCVVDIEARDWIHAYAVGFYDGEDFYRFETPRHPDGRLIGQAHKHRGGRVRRGVRERRTRVRPFRDCRYEFLRFLFSEGKRFSGYWIYAHNGGNYDFIFFLRRLVKDFARHGYETQVILAGSCALGVHIVDPERDEAGDVVMTEEVDDAGNPVLVDGKPLMTTKKKYEWTLVDSARLIPGKLDDVGAAFGVGRKVNLAESLGLPLDSDNRTVYRELSKPKHAAKMWHYCEVDCRVLFESVDFFQRKIMSLGGQVGLTLPATTIDVWRRGPTFPRTLIYKNWHIGDCDGKEGRCWGCGIRYNQRWMRGGRTEIFTTLFESTPEEPFATYVDINAHYAHCMLEDMPVGSAVVTEGGGEAQLWKTARQGYIGAIHCQVYIPEDTYLPPLPFRHNGKLCFPTGRLIGTWDTCELELLAEVGGRVEEVYKSVWYGGSPVFADFIHSLHSMRDKGSPKWNQAMDQIAKLLENSAFGKLAIKEVRERLRIHHRGTRDGMADFDPESDAISEEIIIKPDYLIPQVSAHVTSIARSRLWRYDMGVIKAGGKLYYNDTDSLTFSGCTAKAAGLPVGDKLGELKVEHDKVTMCRFILPKLYAFACASPETGSERPPTAADCICYHQWWKKRVSGEKWDPLTVKAKGLSGGLDDHDLDADEFWRWTDRTLPEADRTIIRRRMAKTRESLNAFVREGSGHRDFPYTVEQVKVLRSNYDKRRVLRGEAGRRGETAPLVLGMGERGPLVEEFRGRSAELPF
jgi:hypothetical protein